MKATILVGIVFIVACYGAVSSLSSGKDDERRADKKIPLVIPPAIRKIGIEIYVMIQQLFRCLSSGKGDERQAVKMIPRPTTKIPIKILQRILPVHKWYSEILQCDVSLPQKTSSFCKEKRNVEVFVMKCLWKLKDDSHGFALLDVSSPTALFFLDLLTPFTRFYLEGYIQTAFTSELGLVVYNDLVQNITDKESGNFDYQVLSTFFEMPANLGGVYSRRPSKYEAFMDDKTDWISDRFFTQQRLAGVNPMSLRRVTVQAGPVGLDLSTLYKTLNKEFNWEGAVRKALETDDPLEEVIKQGRVYVLRYELCDDLPRQMKDLTDNDTRRTMWNTLSPIALFASAENVVTKTNNLVPVAIQMDYTPDSAVYTPEDGDNWKLAKLNVQVTDLGYSQIVEHLAKKRGVDDKTLLPYYPYRDDGEQILKIIEKMVKEYVNLYYYADEDVQKDSEFQSYFLELSNDSPKSYGKISLKNPIIRGLPSKIDTKDELCDFVTRIISQLSVQHAAVNYPLSEYAGFASNLPTKLYNDTRLKEGEYSKRRLPNENTSSIEASFANILALFRFDSLFDYGNELRDHQAAKLVNGYYTYLMNVVQPEMQEKNRKRKEDGFLTYPYLIPRWLPNGIQT